MQPYCTVAGAVVILKHEREKLHIPLREFRQGQLILKTCSTPKTR